MNYIMENLSTIIISAILFGVLARIVYSNFIKGTGGCGCGSECGGCQAGNPCQCDSKPVDIIK